MKNLVFSILALILLGSCSSTKLVSSWRDPDVTVKEGDFKKVMIAVLSPNESNRRQAEDRICKEREVFHPSYEFLKNEEVNKDEAQVQQILKEEGFDGIITVKLIESKETQSYVQGTYRPAYYSRGYRGYHSAYWGGYYEPGYYQTDLEYNVETSFFSIKDDKLIWSGITNTVNPTKLEKTIDEITYLTYKQMVREGFVTKE
jgi:hypothetical protein